VGPVLSNIGTEFGWSGSTAGLLTGPPLISFAVFSPVAPGLARRLGLDQALWVALLLLAAGILGRTFPVEATVWAGTVSGGVLKTAFDTYAVTFFNGRNRRSGWPCG
jgi:CP family cyanate transporter-like MFS transporter